MDVADVLVIGAGAAGAALCWRLSEQSNLRVVCLEQGSYPDPNSYPSTGLHWEETKFDQFHVSPNVRNGPSDYPIDDLDSPSRSQTLMLLVEARFSFPVIFQDSIHRIFVSDLSMALQRTGHLTILT